MSSDLTKYRYLLGQTELFKEFIPESKLIQLNGQKKTKSDKGARFNATEEVLDDVEEDFLEESPSYIKGTLKDYQVHGLNWLVNLYNHNINGILADEMGLGKTIQSISLIGYLKYVKEIDAVHLVIAPKSTLDNWQKEFKKFSDLDVFVLHGNKEDRAQLVHNRLKEKNFDVCITSYEIVIKEKTHFGKLEWQTLVNVRYDIDGIAGTTQLLRGSKVEYMVEAVRKKHGKTMGDVQVAMQVGEHRDIVDINAPLIETSAESWYHVSTTLNVSTGIHVWIKINENKGKVVVMNHGARMDDLLSREGVTTSSLRMGHYNANTIDHATLLSEGSSEDNPYRIWTQMRIWYHFRYSDPDTSQCMFVDYGSRVHVLFERFSHMSLEKVFCLSVRVNTSDLLEENETYYLHVARGTIA